MTPDSREQYLLLRAGKYLCALPLAHIAETMRPQAVRTVAGAPAYVRGLATIRGAAVPVVDAASVLDEGDRTTNPTRFVVVKAGDRRVALAADEVLGIKALDLQSLSALPPLVAGPRQQVASAVGLLDKELLIILHSGRFVPDDVWNALTSGKAW